MWESGCSNSVANFIIRSLFGCGIKSLSFFSLRCIFIIEKYPSQWWANYQPVNHPTTERTVRHPSNIDAILFMSVVETSSWWNGYMLRQGQTYILGDLQQDWAIPQWERNENISKIFTDLSVVFWLNRKETDAKYLFFWETKCSQLQFSFHAMVI